MVAMPKERVEHSNTQSVCHEDLQQWKTGMPHQNWWPAIWETVSNLQDGYEAESFISNIGRPHVQRQHLVSHLASRASCSMTSFSTPPSATAA
jgi:hypothetical protein